LAAWREDQSSSVESPVLAGVAHASKSAEGLRAKASGRVSVLQGLGSR
jgi:hypothetical protein